MSITAPSWAAKCLAQLDASLLPQNNDVAELRAAGVSQERIESLYPFDLRAYRTGVRRLLTRENLEELWRMLQPAHVDEACFCLPATGFDWLREKKSAEASARTRTQKLGYDSLYCDYAKTSIYSAEGPSQKVLLRLYLLPGLLHELRVYPLEGNFAWQLRHERELRRLLPPIQQATEKLVAHIAAQKQG